MPLVVMKFVGAKYGNKNVKIILVKKCPYVVMKYFGGKSEQRTYPHGFSLLYSWHDDGTMWHCLLGAPLVPSSTWDRSATLRGRCVPAT